MPQPEPTYVIPVYVLLLCGLGFFLAASLYVLDIIPGKLRLWLLYRRRPPALADLTFGEFCQYQEGWDNARRTWVNQQSYKHSYDLKERGSKDFTASIQPKKKEKKRRS